MAKLFNTRLELAAIRSICSPKVEVSGHLLASLDDSFFHSDECLEALSLINKDFKSSGSVPKFRNLVEDPRLSDTTKELLIEADTPAANLKAAQTLTTHLGRLRKIRLLYLMFRDGLEQLEKSKVDDEALLRETADKFTQIHAARLGEADLVHFGEDSNAMEVVYEQLFGENEDNVIPTGFKTWDDRNGGFFRGSLVVLGGASGAGKSILMNQLSNNQAAFGYHVDVVPLEMSTSEMVSRTISAQSKYDSIDILLKRLNDDEKQIIFRRMKRFNRRIAKAGGKLNVFKPRTDMTMEEIMSALHSLGSDITYIDYISLLAGVGGDDAWQKLGEVARFGKIFAEIHNRVVCLLAQVSEEGRIRYSQAIKEHASVAWSFVATEESRERGYLNVEPIKSRNQIKFPFTLKINYNTTSVQDLAPDEMRQLDEELQARKSARKSGRRGSKTDNGNEDPAKPKQEASEEDLLPDLN